MFCWQINVYFKHNFIWYVGADNFAKVYTIFLNLRLRIHFTVRPMSILIRLILSCSFDRQR